MTVELWPIERVKPYPKNARKIPERAIESVARSLKEFGWQQPIVVDTEGVIVVGHTRYKAAQRLGMTEVPVHVAAGLSPAQIKAYRLMDNRSHEEARWDLALLPQELSEIRGLDLDLNLTGFTAGEIARLLPSAVEGEDDAPPVPAEPVSRLGDLWLMGEHRLLAGNATSATDTGRVMGASLADTMWTDPPYGVSYVGKTKRALTIAGDDSTGLKQFLETSFSVASTAVKPASPFYIAHPPGARFLVFGLAVEAVGWRIHQNLVWVKDTMVLGHSDYHFQHEPILYGFTPGVGRPGRGKHDGSRWLGDHSQVSVFQIPRPKRSEEHPTMKPVELVRRCLLNSTPRGGSVYEPFAGSGSTIVACEEANFCCRALDIDPAYVDVAVLRWQKFTGKQAHLESGETFEQVAASRKVKVA